MNWRPTIVGNEFDYSWLALMALATDALLIVIYFATGYTAEFLESVLFSVVPAVLAYEPLWWFQHIVYSLILLIFACGWAVMTRIYLTYPLRNTTGVRHALTFFASVVVVLAIQRLLLNIVIYGSWFVLWRPVFFAWWHPIGVLLVVVAVSLFVTDEYGASD